MVGDMNDIIEALESGIKLIGAKNPAVADYVECNCRFRKAAEICRRRYMEMVKEICPEAKDCEK